MFEFALGSEFIVALVGSIASVARVVKDIGEIAKGGRQVLDFADKIYERFAKQLHDDNTNGQLRRAIAQVAGIPPADFAKKAEEIIDVELADKPADYKKAVTEYVKLVQPKVQHNFARPDDPTGTTVPLRWNIGQPEDLVVFLPPRPPMFKEGDTPPGAPQWELTERIGIGGFGEVWRARGKTMTKSLSAFKFCLDPVSQSRIFETELENIELVQNELSDHANIVKLLDAHLEPGETPWLRYQYIGGGDLARLVGTWPDDLEVRAAHAVHTIRILAETLGHCHNELSKTVIHRDIKPANVLVGDKGVLKITDFGISNTQARQALDEARAASASGVSMTTPSLPSQVRWACTPLYASPQQRRGDDPHTSDDVHAMGVMLYQMLMGNLNLELGIDMWDDLKEKHVCPELLNLLSLSVASSVERRYKTGSDLAEALASLPKKLIAPPVIVSVVDVEKQLYEEFERRATDAQAKNEQARKLVESRDWDGAVKTLESIFHPSLRKEDLYTRAIQHRDGKRYTNKLGMEFALIPSGTFWMGGQDGNCGEKEVNIPNDFFMGIYPVTQEEWQKVMGSNPSYFQKGGKGAGELSGVSDAELKRFPVEMVSWENCQAFVKKLNETLKESGFTYRLPRESEWEYACRGAATTQEDCSWSYYFDQPTNTLAPKAANYSESGLKRTCPVGLYEPNSRGIFDMHGNVWEWCEDNYDSSGSYRVLRGGSFNYSAEYSRAAARGNYAPTDSDSYLGLRLARVPSGEGK